LIVDDDSAMRRSLGDMVEADDHEVVGQAGDGRKALEFLADGCHRTCSCSIFTCRS
jgi:chemotaxis response regulator CheB